MNISEGQGNHAAYITCIGISGEVKPPWNNYTMQLETNKDYQCYQWTDLL